MINVDQLNVRYRGAERHAVHELNLRVERGECVLLTGPTGSGKTTLLRAIAGLLQRENVAEMSGRVSVDGVPAEQVNRTAGGPRAAVLFQNPDDQLTGFTAREEVRFTLENNGVRGAALEKQSDAALTFAGIADRADAPIETLSGGQKQRATLASVLAVDPGILLLDEPVASLDAPGRDKFLELLRQLKQRGRTMLICTHEPEWFADIADRILRLTDSGAAATGDASATEPVFARRRWNGTGERPLLETRDLRLTFRRDGFSLGPLSFAIRPGERIALLGRNGSGKSTLLSLLCGIHRRREGEIRFNGSPVSNGRIIPRSAVAYVGQNPDLMLFAATVAGEIGMRPKYLGLPVRERRAAADDLLARFSLAPLARRHPFSLSQGQRQRLAIAAALAGGAELVLIDEPTTGQDREHVARILGGVDELADGGAAVIFSTHHLGIAARVADRVLALRQGTLVFDGAMRDFLADEAATAACGFGRRDRALVSTVADEQIENRAWETGV